MKNQTAFETTNGNVIFQKNNETLIFIARDKNIHPFTNYHGITEFNKLSEVCKPVDFNIEEAENSLNSINAERRRVQSVRALIIVSKKIKLSIKEKNALKKELFNEENVYYVGEFTSTDSSRGKGGYFKYSTSVIADCGFFCRKENNYKSENSKEMISSRKKNYTTPSKSVDFKTFLNFVIAKKEKQMQSDFDKNTKIENAKLMIENFDIFKQDIFNLIS